MSAGTLHYGAKWWRFDFHTHSPASDDYGSGPDQATLKARSPREWLLDCMVAGLDCVAITDHNSGKWIDPLRAELALLDAERPAGYRPLTLFPGVEISVNGGIHILGIFGPEATSDTITGLLSTCGFRGSHGNTDECTEKSCAAVIEDIVLLGGLPILAHADTASGLFVEQSGVTLKQSLRADGLLAMELVNHAFVPPPIYSALNLKLAVVVGSDSHRPAQVGRRFTWVKMETPALEALRLALHDGEDGVKHLSLSNGDPNDIGSRFHLRKLVVSKGQKVGNGQPLSVELSPWLTTLIGGRGSGKSSVLDLLRIVLARTDGMPPQVTREFDSFNQIPKGRAESGMLRAETAIRLEVVKDGRDIALCWRSDGTRTQEELDANGVWVVSGDVGDIAKRFPVRLFSQKQLYEMTQQPDVLLELIDARWDRRAWQHTRETHLDEWLTNRREIRQAAADIAEIAQTRADLEDVAAKIRIFDNSGHRGILNEYQAAQLTKQALDLKGAALRAAAETLRQALSQLPDVEIDAELGLALDTPSAAALNVVLTEYSNVKSSAEAVHSTLASLGERWTAALGGLPWNETLAAATDKYEALKDQLASAGGADISGYSGLVEQRANLEAKVRTLAERESALAKLREDGERIAVQLDEHERLLRTERKRIIADWGRNATGEHIRVSLIDMGNREHAERELRQMIRKPGEEFANDLYRAGEDGVATGMLAELTERGEMPARWAKLKTFRERLLTATYDEPLELDRRFARHLEQLRSNSPEDLDRFAVWTPEDRLKLELVRRDGGVESIESGSAGQRTAGLLGLILRLDDSPLVIDQPEDDLETRLISTLVVSGLRTLKQNQQVIVVTHNPNIPVNGAAEQIVEMQFEKGQIRTGSMGALQRKEIRQAVCEVMEGGKDALDKRYYRISQALS